MNSIASLAGHRRRRTNELCVVFLAQISQSIIFEIDKGLIKCLVAERLPRFDGVDRLYIYTADLVPLYPLK